MKLENIFQDSTSYIKAIRCFYGNQELFRQSLIQFPDDPTFSILKKHMVLGELSSALKSAGVLMNISTNLGLEELKEWCEALMVSIRKNANCIVSQTLFSELSKVYYDIIVKILLESQSNIKVA